MHGIRFNPDGHPRFGGEMIRSGWQWRGSRGGQAGFEIGAAAFDVLACALGHWSARARDEKNQVATGANELQTVGDAVAV